jgi:hypothetical protein
MIYLIKLLYKKIDLPMLLILLSIATLVYAATAKLSAITNLGAAPAATDELYLNDAGTEKALTISNLFSYLASDHSLANITSDISSNEPQSLTVTTEANITLTSSLLLLTGDNDSDNDTIDLQDGTYSGQKLRVVAVANVDSNDTLTIDATTDSTCTGCPTILMDSVGDTWDLVWSGSTWSAGWASGGVGTLSNVVEDVTPQLGGDLDMNSKNIDFPSTANISDVKDEDNMASNSATMLATQQSIKAYADAIDANRPTVVVSDADADPTVNDDTDGSPTAATPDVSGYSVGDIYINGTQCR